jgi:hypothetical protein
MPKVKRQRRRRGSSSPGDAPNIRQDQANDLDQRGEQILAQLVSMIAHPEEWTVGANRKPVAGEAEKRRRGGVEKERVQ